MAYLGLGVVSGACVVAGPPVYAKTADSLEDLRQRWRIRWECADRVDIKPLFTVRTHVGAAEQAANERRRKGMETLIRSLQERICWYAEQIEADATPRGETPATFLNDVWYRDEGEGGGITRVIQDGRVFEKAGVNVSCVTGHLPPNAVKAMRANHAGLDHIIADDKGVPFFACGVSVVIHGHNPMVPTAHCNYRIFEIGKLDENGEPEAWWVGGGSDLTPSYLNEEDAIHFHTVNKNACDTYDAGWYSTFKTWCDRYFYLAHRKESRGVGGIFFDDIVDTSEHGRGRLLSFLDTCGKVFCDSYFPIVEARKDSATTEQQKKWQELRRGRYVEFNLLWDRGTKFGIFTPNARVESILMSLPLHARWEYRHPIQRGSEEERITNVLQHPVDWVPLES